MIATIPAYCGKTSCLYRNWYKLNEFQWREESAWKSALFYNIARIPNESASDFRPHCIWNDYSSEKVIRSSKRDRRPLMENKFEHPRVRDARCFECLPNLRGDVRYKERHRHRGTKWHSRRKLKGRFSIAHLPAQSIFQRSAHLSLEAKSQLRALRDDNGSFIREGLARYTCDDSDFYHFVTFQFCHLWKRRNRLWAIKAASYLLKKRKFVKNWTDQFNEMFSYITVH